MTASRTILAAALTVLSIACTAAAPAPPSPDPAGAAADRAEASAQAAQVERPTFDPTMTRCQHAPTAPADRRWETSTPKPAAKPASIVPLGLSGGAWNQPVTVTVTAPDGSQRQVTEPLAQSGRISIAYPVPPALPGPESRVPGVYTVVWSDATSGAFLACDGFVVER